MVLVYAITRASQHGWTDSTTLALLATAGALIVAFVGIEARSPAPLLPLRIFRLRTLSAANATMLVSGAAAFGQFFLLTLYLQEVLRYSAIETGVAFIAIALTIVAVSNARPGADDPARPTTGADRRVAAHRGRHGALRPDARRRSLLLGRLPRAARRRDRARLLVRPGDDREPHRCRAGRRGCRLGADQHQPPDRRLDRPGRRDDDRRHRVQQLRREPRDAASVARRWHTASRSRFYVLIGLALAGAVIAAVFVESQPPKAATGPSRSRPRPPSKRRPDVTCPLPVRPFVAPRQQIQGGHSEHHTDTQIADLRASLNGKVIGADDPRYDDARRVVFTGFDRRPAAIVARHRRGRRRPRGDAGAGDGRRARGAKRRPQPRGHGTTEGGIVLDLSAMNAIEIDADGRTAWARDREPRPASYTTATAALRPRHRARRHGHRRPWRDHPGRRHRLPRAQNGLTIDDLLAAEVVTADGELLRWTSSSTPISSGRCAAAAATSVSPPGSGSGCTRSTSVVGGMLMLPGSADVIAGLVAAADAAPEQLSMIANILKAPPLPFIPAEQHGKPVVIALMVYAGGAEAGEPAIAPIRALANPLADMVRPIRYPEMYAGPEAPPPAYGAGTNMLVDGLPERGAEIDPRASRDGHRPDGGSPAARARRRDGARPRRRDGVRPPGSEADGEHRRHVSAARGARGARSVGGGP